MRIESSSISFFWLFFSLLPLDLDLALSLSTSSSSTLFHLFHLSFPFIANHLK